MAREARRLKCSRVLAGAFMAVTRARMSRARSSRGFEAFSRRSRRASEVASMSSRSRLRRVRAAASMSRRSASGMVGSRRRMSHSAMASRISVKVCCSESGLADGPATSPGDNGCGSAVCRSDVLVCSDCVCLAGLFIAPFSIYILSSLTKFSQFSSISDT